MQSDIAIVVFAYKRPDKLKQLLKSLLSEFDIEKYSIYVFIDGAKNDDDYLLTNRCFDVCSQYLPVSAKIILRDRNLGSRKSIIEGLNSVFTNHAKCIVLEDDLIIFPGFEDFVCRGLEVHEKDSSILGISAYQPLNLIQKPEETAVEEIFGYRPQSWGWATWEDRWSLIKWDENFLLSQLSETKVRIALTRMGFDVVPMVRSMIQETIDAWDVGLCVHAASRDLRFIYPRTTFTTNDGFGDDATHTIEIEYPNFKVLRVLEFVLSKVFFKSFSEFFFHAMILKHYSTSLAKAADHFWIKTLK